MGPVALCVPSRGLVHSRTMAEIFKVIKNNPNVFLVMVHGVNIPGCFNQMVAKALESKPEYIFIVEDDMQLPEGILTRLFLAGGDITLSDYPIQGHHTVTFNSRGKFQYAGLGCVLVKRWIFEKLEQPWFRTDTDYQEEGDELIPTPSKERHGGQDVDFYQRVLKLNPSITIVDAPVGHYELVKPELPKRGNNTASEYEVKLWLFDT